MAPPQIQLRLYLVFFAAEAESLALMLRGQRTFHPFLFSFALPSLSLSSPLILSGESQPAAELALARCKRLFRRLLERRSPFTERHLPLYTCPVTFWII